MLGVITEDPDVRKKLGATKDRLRRELAAAGNTVPECFDRAVQELAAQAQIAEFLPALAERRTRLCVDETAASLRD